MGGLSNLPNIGKVLGTQLHEVGIDTPEQLRELGSREAWLLIQTLDTSACYSRLCALEGAIQGIRWHDLSPKEKQSLKVFYSSHRLEK